MAQSQDGRDTVQEWVHKQKERNQRKELGLGLTVTRRVLRTVCKSDVKIRASAMIRVREESLRQFELVLVRSAVALCEQGERERDYRGWPPPAALAPARVLLRRFPNG